MLQHDAQCFSIHTANMPFGKFHLDRARYSCGDLPTLRSIHFAGLRLTYMHRQQVHRPSILLPSSPWRYCRRQLNTWLAFTPCASATRATDAPGFKVCSTIRHFSPTGQRRLCDSLLTTAHSEVSIYSPSGHFHRCPLRAIFHIHPHFVQMS